MYRRNDSESDGYRADYAGMARHVPISLPRVRWLESDDDCPYVLASEVDARKEKEISADENASADRTRRRRSSGTRAGVLAPKWTAEEDALAKSLRKKGASPEEIALKCGRSRKAVLQRFRKQDAEEAAKAKSRGKSRNV